MTGIVARVEDLRARMRDLIAHPEASGQDKASLVLASTALSGITHRHTARGRSFAPVPGLDPGWLVRRERAEEAEQVDAPAGRCA